MKKRNLFATFFAFMTLLSGVALATSLAWFMPSAVMSGDMKGITIGAYYAYGEGTAENPYGINKPRHLYNLAWLQYLGRYNDNQGTQKYFELDDNIDMTGWVIPPIGTAENPFIGNFNGKGYVVSNLTISNDFSKMEKHPTRVHSNTFVQPHILGFFGVVGDYNNSYSGEGKVYNNSINKFYNTGLTGVTVDTVVKDSLLGVAAGYCSGILSNVAVDASTLNVDKNISESTTSYGSHTSNISDYSLVGYTTHTKTIQKVDETIYNVNSSSGYEFNGADQGTIDGWGGSIDMMSVTQRLQAIRDTGTQTNFVYHKTITDYEGKADVTTNTYTDTKYTILKNDNDEIGHFNFIGTDSQEVWNRYALLGGGHWETHNNYNKVSHSGYKITDGKGHYLKASTFTTGSTGNSNAGTIANSSDSNGSIATVWSVPASGSGFISTTYHYNDSNNATTYYLYWTGSALRLSTYTSGTTYRTSFTRETDSNGNIRFSYDNKYLTFNGASWTMISIPTILDVPELPVENPVEPEEPDYDSYLANSYQIAYDDGTNYHFMSTAGTNDTSSTTALSPSSNYGWQFERTNGNIVSFENIGNNSVYIITYINSQKYYLAEGPRANNYRYIITTDKGLSGDSGTVRTFTKSTSGSNYILTSSSGNRYYLEYSQTRTAFEDNGLGADGNPVNTLTIKTTRTFLEEPYNEALALYNEQINYRDNVYPGLKDAYDASVTAYNNSFEISLVQDTVSGPDEHLVNTNGTGMHYEGDDVTYFPLTTNNNTDDFRPADNNTAYVVGGSSITANTSSYDDELTNVRFGYYPISGNIDGDYNSSTGNFDHVYTINDSLQQVEITNSTAYEKLADAKKNLGGIMKNQSNVYGLHFMEATISMNALTTANYVKVNRETHTNYELPVNSIDFNLKEFGYINFMAGSYYSTTNKRNNSFFALYQIERLPATPGKINRILEIKNIYKHTSGTKNYSYVYELTDGNSTFYTKPYKVVDAAGNKEWLYGTGNYAPNQYENSLPSNYELAFNCNRIKKNNLNSATFDKHAYFFEIPMNDGEFCLGSVSGAVGSYLMYLDIGANASKFQRSIFYEHFTSTLKTYRYPEGVALKSLPNSYISKTPVIPLTEQAFDELDSACVSINAGYRDAFSLDRNNGDVSLTRSNTSNAPPIYAGEAITKIHDKNSETSLTISSLSSSSKEYKRMTYFDVNVNMGALTKTAVTDVSINGGGYLASNRTIVQTIYSGKSADVTPSATYIYDLSQSRDDRSSMKVFNTDNGRKISDAELINLSAFGIADNYLSNDSILTVRLIQAGSGSYTENITLLATYDNTNLEETYYTYNGYRIIITPTGAALTVRVISINSNKPIYYGTVQATSANQEIIISLS